MKGELTTDHKAITLPIHGMRCISCVAHVDGALRDVPGVIDVDVKLATNEAVISFIDGLASIEMIKDAVSKAGYAVP